MECPYCRSSKVAKQGTIATVTKGKRQRFKCQDCGKTFYEKESK